MIPTIRKDEFHPDSYQEYLERHYKRNMVVNILDVSFFWFAMSMVSVAVVLPAFCLRLGASNTLIAFLPTLMVISWFLPQLFVSFYVEGLFRKKPFVLFFGIFQRLPWICIGFFTMYLLPEYPHLVLILFFICYFIGFFAAGIEAPAWGEMIAKAVPLRLRGFFSGMTNVTGNGFAIIGGIIVKFVMKYFSFPNNYAILFFSTAAFLIISYIFFILNREPILIPVKKHKNILDYFHSLPLVLKRDRNFTFFIISNILGYSNVMATAFFMVYSMKTFNVSEAISGNYIIAYTATAMAASFVLARVGDSKGHKINMVISRIFYILAPLVAIIAWAPWVMYLVFVFMSIGFSSFMLSRNNIIFEFSPEGKRPTYLGLVGTLTAPFVILFSFLGGKLADHPALGYHLPFYVSIILNIISLIILAGFVKDPRRA